MIRRPPRSTRTDTRVPDTTRFRSPAAAPQAAPGVPIVTAEHVQQVEGLIRVNVDRASAVQAVANTVAGGDPAFRSEEHTSELQSLMRISYAVFCLKKKQQDK